MVPAPGLSYRRASPTAGPSARGGGYPVEPAEAGGGRIASVADGDDPPAGATRRLLDGLPDEPDPLVRPFVHAALVPGQPADAAAPQGRQRGRDLLGRPGADVGGEVR